MNGNVKNWAEEREESKKEDAKNTLYRNKVGWSGGVRRGADFQSYLDNWALLKSQWVCVLQPAGNASEKQQYPLLKPIQFLSRNVSKARVPVLP